MPAIITGIVGLLLAGATVAGVVTSVSSNDRPAPKSPTANVQLYGQR